MQLVRYLAVDPFPCFCIAQEAFNIADYMMYCPAAKTFTSRLNIVVDIAG